MTAGATQTGRGWVGLGIAVAILLGCGAYAATHLTVTTSITHFLPGGTDRQLARISSRLAESELTRTLILTVGGPEPAATRAATAELKPPEDVQWMVDVDPLAML